MSENLKLCYVAGHFAYFTSRELSDQWGDDWDDAPYEHNAEEPYIDQSGKPGVIVKVAFDGDFRQPCDDHYNSPFSVEMINRGDIAWLRGEKAPIYAGVSVADFKALVALNGGNVYERTGEK